MGSGAANLVISLVWGDGLPTGGGPENVTAGDEEGRGDGRETSLRRGRGQAAAKRPSCRPTVPGTGSAGRRAREQQDGGILDTR